MSGIDSRRIGDERNDLRRRGRHGGCRSRDCYACPRDALRAQRVFHRQPEAVVLPGGCGESGDGTGGCGKRDPRSRFLHPLIGDRIAIRIVGSRSIQGHRCRARQRLVRTSVRHRCRVARAHRPRQHFIAHARNLYRDGVLGIQIVGRPDAVAELHARHHAPVVAAPQQRLVHAAFQRERDLIADREDQAQGAAHAVARRGAAQISDIAFKVVPAEQGRRAAQARLIHHTQVTLGHQIVHEEAGGSNHIPAIHDRVVEERLGSERANLAPPEQVFQGESAFSQSAAGLIAGQIDVLEAGEQSRLEAADAVHQSEVELALALALVIEVLAFRLERIVVPEGREVAALAGKGYVAGVVRAEVQAQHLELGQLLFLERGRHGVRHFICGGRGRRRWWWRLVHLGR